MARTVRRKHPTQPIAELNVTNMIDLGFTLLIIFMITTSYSQQEQTIPVNLPTVAKTPQQKADKADKFVALSVDAAGSFYVDNGSTPISVADLRRKLAGLAAESKQPVIRIRGDGKAFYEKVAQLLNEVQSAGLTRVTFDDQVKN
jgi:biopolymer transport protein TolR